MSNPSGPDQGNEPAAESADEHADDASAPEDGTDIARRLGQRTATEAAPVVSDEPPIVEDHPTEVMAVESTGTVQESPQDESLAVRRFTAPSGMDSSTRKIETPPEPATEVMSAATGPICFGQTALRHRSFRRAGMRPSRQGPDAAGAGWWQ